MFLFAEGIGSSRFIKQTTQESERPDLGNARVVITGGRALKSVENFKMLEKLAEKLGGAGSFNELNFLKFPVKESRCALKHKKAFS